MIIYKITNLKNNKVYFGLTTKSLEIRWKGHLTSAKEGSPFRIHQAIRKYGVESFKIEKIATARTVASLYKKEDYYIKKYNSLDPSCGYNMVCNVKPVDFTPAVRRKMSISQKKWLTARSPERKLAFYEKTSRTHQGTKHNKNNPYVGVSFEQNRYITYVTFRRKSYSARFLTAIEAAEAYDKLVLYLYGPEAKLNFSEKRPEYLKEDLELFTDFITNRRCRMGRPSTHDFLFSKLIPEAKQRAARNLTKLLPKLLETAQKGSPIFTERLLTITFKYNGDISPDFLLKYDE